jgi:ribose/xylose/arabinose/galactoside ABC-type transport system permease subunit
MVDLKAGDRDPLRFLRRHEPSLMLALVLVIGLTAILDSQHNYFKDPWTSCVQITRQASLLGIFALGSAIVIIAGGIDLSSGSVICFSGTICATLLLVLAPEQMQSRDAPIDLSIVSIAIAGTLVVGLLIGSLHAWLITVVGLPPFVATLATLVGLRSFARAICENVTETAIGGRSTQIQIFDARFRYLATSVWIPATLFLLLSIIGWVILSKTVLGRHLYALGGNEEAARLSGVRTDRMKWFAYCASAVLSSIAGILYICEVSVAEPQTLGRGYELNSIAAAVVGGCSLQGGVGTVQGTVLGAIFLRVVIDGVAKIIKTGADVYEGLIVGVVVVFAVAFSQTERRGLRTSFLAGGMGLVATINLALMAGAMALLVGPTLLEGLLSVLSLVTGPKLTKGMITLEGPFLGLWTAASVFALLLLLRSGMSGRRRAGAAIGLAIGVLALFFGLNSGVPAYRLYAATSAVRADGGTITKDPAGGTVVNLSGTDLDDHSLKLLIDRLRALPNVTELSLARTKVTDQGMTSIKAVTTLKRLDLSETKVSRSGKTVLGRSLPDLEIVD